MECRRRHNEEICDLYCSPDIIGVVKRRVIRVGHVTRIGESRGPFRVSMVRPEGKRPFGRRRYRREIILYRTLNFRRLMSTIVDVPHR